MVRETSTTTGTGTYNLAGAASGFNGYVAAGFDAKVVVYRAQTGNDWEIALGTITDASPDTLARTEILETLVSGTYDNTSPSAVDWAAGTRTIDLIGPAQNIAADSGNFLPHPGQTVDDRYYSCANIQAAGKTLTLDKQRFFIYYHARYSKIDIEAETTIAESGKVWDIGLYTTKDGDPDVLLESTTNLSLTSAGTVTFTTSNLYQPGWYWLSYNTNALGTAEGRGTSDPPVHLGLFMGQNGLISGFWVCLQVDRTFTSGLLNPVSGTLTPQDGTLILAARPSA